MSVSRPFTLADGQLGTTAATVLSGADAPGGVASVVLSNVGSNKETVTLSFRRAGGTARQLARRRLEPDESLHLLGLALQPDDLLLGFATTGEVIDYLAVSAGGQLATFVLDASGVKK